MGELGLQFKGRSLRISEEHFVVGRSEDCNLTLDDPLASRRHAAFYYVGARLVVEDLGSRNGVQVNGQSISKMVELAAGDRVHIAEQLFEVAPVLRKARSETLIRTPSDNQVSTFGVLGALAEKSLRLGQGAEGERILGRLLQDILAQAETAAKDATAPMARDAAKNETFERATKYALKIAELTHKGEWIDYLFRLYTAYEELMDAELVNQLYSIAPRSKGASRPLLRKYVQVLSMHVADYSPGQKFVLGRLEGIEALL